MGDEKFVFLESFEVMEEVGIRPKYSLIETVVRIDIPATVVAFGQGHRFLTEEVEGIRISPSLKTFYVHFIYENSHPEVIFAESREPALFFMKHIYNEEIVRCVEEEHTIKNVIWKNDNAVGM